MRGHRRRQALNTSQYREISFIAECLSLESRSCASVSFDSWHYIAMKMTHEMGHISMSMPFSFAISMSLGCFCREKLDNK